VLSLAGGLPAAETFPLAELARSLGAVGPSALQYDWPEGRKGLREWVAERLSLRGAKVSSEDVLITSGAQQALDIAVALSEEAAGTIAVPRACYPGAIDLFRARGAHLTLDEGSASLVYAMPALANPTGVAQPASQADAWLSSRVSLLEDDAYAELRFDGRLLEPLLARAPERVLHVGTLSKTLCPGLRIGWLVAPPHLRARARREKQLTDLQGNTLAQRIVEGYLEQEDYEQRLERLRAFYASRAEALVASLRRELPGARFVEPEGGFSLWLETEEEGDDVHLLRLALRHGTSFDPGSDFMPEKAGKQICLRLAFSSLPATSIPEAVKRLARALSEHKRGSAALHA
jgi:2-aminoadipate transaminase